MANRKRIYSAILVVGILTFGGAGGLLLAVFGAEASQSEPRREVRSVRTRLLVAGPQTVSIESEGFLESARSIAIHSPADGQVLQTLDGLKGGVRAEKGDILLRLDDRRARLALEAARTDAVRKILSFITAAGLSEPEQARWNGFAAKLRNGSAGGVPPLPEMTERQYLLAITMGVVAARLEAESAAVDLESRTVTAPFSGLLSGEGVSEGALVTRGESLAILAEFRRLELPLSLNIDDFALVSVGDRAEVRTEDGGRSTVARVVRVEPILRAGSQMARIHAVLETEDDSEWLPGTFVAATIQGRVFDSAYRIPRNVLVAGRLPVFDSGRLAFLPVEVLARDGTDVVVAPELPAGTEMVETVLQDPIEGMPLRRDVGK